MKIFYLLMTLLIFVTACTGQVVRTDENNGLRINDFSADPQSAEFDDDVRFYLDVENVGGTTARCVKAEIFGVDGSAGWYNSDGTPFTDYYTRYANAGSFGSDNFNIEYSNVNGNLRICYRGNLLGNLIEWIDRRSGSDPVEVVRTNEAVCYTRTRQDDSSLNVYVGAVWNDFTNAICGVYSELPNQFSNIKYFGELQPPLPERNRPGQFVTADWIILPPQLPEGTSVNYPVTVRVSYVYSSTATINVRAFNRDEFRRRQDKGESVLFPADIQNSFGSPIKVVLTKETSPIVVNQRALSVPGSSPFELATYVIELQNMGDGFPLPVESDAYGPTGMVFGTVSVGGPGVSFGDCMGQRGNGQTTLFLGQDNFVKLRSNNRVPFGCTLQIDRAAWADRPTDTVTLIFDMWYVYYVDKETTIKVIGKERI